MEFVGFTFVIIDPIFLEWGDFSVLSGKSVDQYASVGTSSAPLTRIRRLTSTFSLARLHPLWLEGR